VIDVFLTGTEPAVGKTHLAGQLAAGFLARGRKPGYLKAVETGSGDDARVVAAAAPGTVCATVYRYVTPLAPAIAARLQHGAPPEVEHLVEATEELRAATEGVIVEGHGGLLTPLNDEATIADLVAALGLPLVIVTVPTQASLNHVALTAEAARRRGITVLGIAVNRCSNRPDLAERTTRAEFARVAPVLVSLPIEETAAVER
jgi:dethiobiotin synthetase